MKRVLKLILLFAIEVGIPFICLPVLPSLLKTCSEADAILIGSSISIFIAIWTLTNKVYGSEKELDSHRTGTRNGFDGINQRLDTYGAITMFEDELRNVKSPYFRKRINVALQKTLEEFKETNRNSLFDGYIEVQPYDTNTYGTEGIKDTKSELLAVSSVENYWDRPGFASEYSETQYMLIKDHNIVIKRIFIGKKEWIKQLRKVMREQHNHGIKIYYIETDTGFCPDEWKNEDILIQDGMLLVELQAKTHAPNEETKEIITTRSSLVMQKKALFKQLLGSATEFS